MGIPYESNTSHPGLTGGDYITIDFPHRAEIGKIVIVGPTNYNATVYSKEIVRSTIVISHITSDPLLPTKTLLHPDGPVHFVGKVARLVEVGEQLVVTDTTYNATHTVTAVYDNGTIGTDQTYVADDISTAGSAVPTVPTADRPLYEVMPLDAASSGLVQDFTKRSFVNMDPPTELGKRRKIYVLISADGNYKVAINGSTDVV
jgi:hypothetical protein